MPLINPGTTAVPTLLAAYGSKIREVNKLYETNNQWSWRTAVKELADELILAMNRVEYRPADGSFISMDVRTCRVLKLFKVKERWASVFPGDWRDRYENCTECGEWHFSANMSYAYDDDAICESCRDEYYFYDDDRDTYRHRYDDSEEEIEEEVLAYNADPLDYLSFQALPAERKVASEKNPLMYLGIELEVERNKARGDRHINREVAELLDGTAIVKHDGSLDDGFEIVSAPMTLAYHYAGANGKSPWDAFFDGPAKHLRSWITDTCGIHVHISRNVLTPMHLGKMIVFVNAEHNREFIQRIAGRHMNNWCEPQGSAKVQDVLKGSTQGKYTALNLERSSTVELRIFRGNTKKAGFFRCLDFAAAMTEFTRNASITALKASDFISWMDKQRHSYPHLATWLVQTEMLEATRNRIDPVLLSSTRMSHEDRASANAIR